MSAVRHEAKGAGAMHWVRPIVFGLGFVLCAAMMKILVRSALVKAFGSLENYRTFVRDRVRMIRQR